MKRVLSVLFTIALIVFITITVNTAVLAEQSGDFTYLIENDSATITQYTGLGGEVIIPESLGGYPVTFIDMGAFQYCKGLTNITIPDSVTSISHGSFSNCEGLTNVTIPDSVTYIGMGAFRGCTGLTVVTIPNSVTCIDRLAFANCTGLISVTIPDSVINIGDEAFNGCTSLTAAIFLGNAPLITIDTDKEDADSIFSNCAPTFKVYYINGKTGFTNPWYGQPTTKEIFVSAENGPTPTPIAVTLNGKTIAFDQPPMIVDDRTLVPLRAIFEALGAQVGWDDTTQTVTATKGSVTISVQIGSMVATVNGESKTLDVSAQIINDRTMVPVRFISESLGCKVNWDGENNSVVITN